MQQNLLQTDPEVAELIANEETRQQDTLMLIPSENYTSQAVREASGSVLTNKYSEGYAGKRYYAGNEFIDSIEELTIARVKKLFGVPHANVQPYSGSPANLAVYLATCNVNDLILGLSLPDGGHLTHGWKVSATAAYYQSHQYHVLADGRIDFQEVEELAQKYQPKLIWAGATAHMYKYDYKKFAEIAESVGAYFAADIAHVAGLIVAGVHPNPVPYAHIITTTTHKTLRGPRGGMIAVTQKGLEKDSSLAEKIDKAVFPGLQGGPHNHQTAAIAVALLEASQPEFIEYGKQIIINAKVLAEHLAAHGLKLVGNGTENHLLLVDLIPILGVGGGVLAQDALEAAGMTANKNTIPQDPSSPFFPSGLRLGTPAITTRGMGEGEMRQIAKWIAEVINIIKDERLPEEKGARTDYLLKFKQRVKEYSKLQTIREQV